MATGVKDRTDSKYDLQYWEQMRLMDPNLPETPLAFNLELMPELNDPAQRTSGMPLQKTLKQIFAATTEFHKFLKDLRNPLEDDWIASRSYYDMADELAQDSQRKKSINAHEKRRPNAELKPERNALVLPLVYEAVKLLEANLYGTMRGSGSEYCEILGTERADFQAARVAQAILNYQQHYEIPTPDLISDLINGALIEGTGVFVQEWQNGKRIVHVPERTDIWWDSAAHIKDCRMIIWRKRVSYGELLEQRARGDIYFSDSDMLAARNNRVDQSGKSGVNDDSNNRRKFSLNLTKEKMKKVSPRHEILTLDIAMDTQPDRWIYIVNETLVVSVTQPSIPDGQHGESRFPVTAFAPVRKKGMIDGDSIANRMMNSQDMANSVFAMLTENMKRNALGVPVTDDPNMEGEELIAGKWHYSSDPKGVTNLQFPDISGQCISVTEYIRNRINDPLSGATDSLRGQATFSGQTATGTRDLLQQSATRISEMQDMGVTAIQDFYTVGLILNQLYLDGSMGVRITGEDGQGVIWQPGNSDQGRPVEREDLYGVAGKDLVPSGYTGAGSKYMITQEALNEAAVVGQVGGNPQPLVERYLKAKYGRSVDMEKVFPANGIGHDPMQENRNLMQGMPIRRDPDDLDQWHMQAHQGVMADPQFQELMQNNPQIYMALEAHAQEHMMALQQYAQQMAGTNIGGGLGGGIGPAGGSTANVGNARPKQQSELENQK